MVSRASIKTSGYKSLQDYFKGILEHKVNENLSEIWLMICALSKPQGILFLEWLTQEKRESNETNDYEYLTSLTLQIMKR